MRYFLPRDRPRDFPPEPAGVGSGDRDLPLPEVLGVASAGWPRGVRLRFGLRRGSGDCRLRCRPLPVRSGAAPISLAAASDAVGAAETSKLMTTMGTRTAAKAEAYRW